MLPNKTRLSVFVLVVWPARFHGFIIMLIIPTSGYWLYVIFHKRLHDIIINMNYSLEINAAVRVSGRAGVCVGVWFASGIGHVRTNTRVNIKRRTGAGWVGDKDVKGIAFCHCCCSRSVRIECFCFSIFKLYRSMFVLFTYVCVK